MQLITLEVKDLFGRFNYEIPLRGPGGDGIPVDSHDTVTPSIVILLGPNGSGKTTVLNMINGMLSLNFNIFRAVPFGSAALRFSSGESICVHPIESDGLPPPLAVDYKDHHVVLHPLRVGALDEKGLPEVEEFRSAYVEDTATLDCSLIYTQRL